MSTDRTIHVELYFLSRYPRLAEILEGQELWNVQVFLTIQGLYTRFYQSIKKRGFSVYGIVVDEEFFNNFQSESIPIPEFIGKSGELKLEVKSYSDFRLLINEEDPDIRIATENISKFIERPRECVFEYVKYFKEKYNKSQKGRKKPTIVLLASEERLQEEEDLYRVVRDVVNEHEFHLGDYKKIQDFGSSSFANDIREYIREADGCIVDYHDFKKAKENLIYETGYAQGMKGLNRVLLLTTVNPEKQKRVVPSMLKDIHFVQVKARKINSDFKKELSKKMKILKKSCEEEGFQNG